MIQLFRVEWKRCVHGKGFRIAVLIGLFLAVAHAVQVLIYIHGASKYADFLLTENYLGEDLNFVWHEIYCWIFPVLVALPFSTSYFYDKENGYWNQLICRKGRKKVYLVRYIVSFISGMVVAIIPLFVNLMIMSVFLPVGKPAAYNLVSVINQNCIMGNLHYTQPILYMVLFWGIIAVFGGMLSCVALMLGNYIRNAFYIMVLPSFILIFGDIFLQQCKLSMWSILCMINEGQLHELDYLPLVCTWLIGVIVTGIGFIVYIGRKDVLVS